MSILKIEKQMLEDHQVRLTVEIEDDRVDQMRHRAAAKLARRVKIPGFRPGKAPYPVIVRTVGDPAIFEEALEMLLDEVYPEMIKEADIKPYGPGHLENLPKLEPLTLEIVVPLDAEVTLGDYKAIRREYKPEPVPESRVDEMLDALRERQVIVEPVDRPAQLDDMVTVSISIEKVLDEGSESLFKEQPVPLVVHKVDEDDWPFAGFSHSLIGKSAGDEGTVEHQYPDDFSEEYLSGVKAIVHYKIENVKSRTLPELNDEFASSVGEFDNLDALRANVRSMLEGQAKETYNQDYDEEVIDEAIAQAEFKYPPQMLDEEIEQMKRDLVRRLERQNLDLEIYLKSREMDEDAFKEELKPVAEQRLKRGLLLFELTKAEDIQVESEELIQETGSTLNYLSQVLPKNEARQLKNRNVQSNLANNVLLDLLTNKTIERLRKIANGQYEAEAGESVPETPEQATLEAEQSAAEEPVVEQIQEEVEEQANEVSGEQHA
ncbi:MAG: trigger factor [Anaerolineae bacterium UTCFX2]|nr:MAG: trigger factor [Anaerolineae bacterium UTCFX2]